MQSRFGNIEVKAITSQNQYEEYLSFVDRLMDDDAEATSQDVFYLKRLLL